jgi:hypothetical protein
VRGRLVALLFLGIVAGGHGRARFAQETGQEWPPSNSAHAQDSYSMIGDCLANTVYAR